MTAPSPANSPNSDRSSPARGRARKPRYRTGDAALDAQIGELVDTMALSSNADLAFEMLATVAGLSRDGADRGDLKLVNASLQELRRTFKVFAPYRQERKAVIFGSARTSTDDPLYHQTVDVARLLAHHDWMVITGAGPGIMAAGIEGAGAEASFGLPIRLPFEAATTELPPERLITFRYFFTRKLTFIKESDAFIVLPGGFGTLDEAFELLTLIQTGKAPTNPIVLLDVPGGTYWTTWLAFLRSELGARGYISESDLCLFRLTDDAQAAVDEVNWFYRNYHSQRFVDRHLVIRLRRAPTPDELSALNEQFADIVVSGAIEAVDASRAELDDDDAPELPRLRFRFDRYHHARLRELIDAVNLWP